MKEGFTMSFPNIPDVNSKISFRQEDAINILLASIAFEELGLAHIINAEAEKIQFVLGTLKTDAIERNPSPPPLPTIEDLLEIDRSVEQTLKTVIKTEILLQFKLEEIENISTSSTTTSTTTTTTTTTRKTNGD
jgi:hypothetical protein